MSLQKQLSLAEPKDQSTSTTEEEYPVAFKALRVPQGTDHGQVILEEAKKKTETIAEIAKNHPDIKVQSGTLPSGYIVSYHLKGGSLMSKHESEDEFIQRIKRAIPKELRSKHDYFRGTLTRELDSLTVWVGPNFRFCPMTNINEIVDLFENAKTVGVGKKEISVANIIEALLEHKDEINVRAEDLGISERINTKEQLQMKIRFLPLIFDISFHSAAMGIDSNTVSRIKSDMEKEFKSEIESDLKSRMQKVLKTLSKSLKTIKTSSKRGKSMHKRTHDALMRNMEEIEKLNITESEELKNMIKLSKALTEALTNQDLRTYAKNIEDSTAKMPEQIFAEAFRKSAHVDTKSDDDKALNLVIEEIVSQL
jgi:hypothetical protein